MSEDQIIETSEPEEAEDDYSLDQKAVAKILNAVDLEDRGLLIELMDPLHPADIADLLEQINSFDRMRLIKLYGKEFDGDILSEVHESIRRSHWHVVARGSGGCGP